MADIEIPSLGSGEAIFGAAGYKNADFPNGVARFIVLSLSHGIEIDYSESRARRLKSIYFKRKKVDNFSVTLHFAEYEAYLKAIGFFEGYIEFATQYEQSGTLNPMGMLFPDRN